MKVEIIGRETIKPSLPTPSHLKNYKLSSLDQLSLAIYGRVVFFYTQNDVTSGPKQKSQQLKNSLSETLSHFYPIAGINNNITIECTDDGAPYVEAKFNGPLSTFLELRDDPAVIDQFFPAAIQSPEASTWPLLQVQATFFDCGGLAVGVCLSHKVCDARSMSVFMKTWVEISKGSAQTVVPVFDAVSYFPPAEQLSLPLPAPGSNKPGERITKMFVFDKQKIADLKAKTTGYRVQQPSRVEVVTALIWKCVMALSRCNTAGVPKKTFFVTQAMDIRNRADPPMPEHSIGNLFTVIPALINHDDENELELADVVSELRKAIRAFNENQAKRLRGEGALQVIFEVVKQILELFGRDDTDGLMVTSLCTFKLYEVADFGWGKPTWVNILPLEDGASKLVALMDTRDGGVEAWVTLGKDDMALFERSPELLEFAIQNYSAI
ncbi:Transferase [Parasponia andersonii]|uniref:Transferase n=1 Tax=Parasponia andersonii TaxID=3476 RepID=A0A2P5CUM0_PARAD|nr:Transferase [Parasponia andersonii]